MLRSRKLLALATEELSISNLRSLFRLLDDDGSGEVSSLEIRRGLKLLGFPEADDPVALSRVVSDIDEDNTVRAYVCPEFLVNAWWPEHAGVGTFLMARR
jgi:hypothetical protein